jgi:glycosyltransferase involved in cell wall biosynthesis
MMRIAIIAETFLPNVNGVVTTLCRLLEHLQREGHEALLFAPCGSPTSYAGAQIVPLAGMPLPMYPELQLTLPQVGFTEQIKRFQPDLIHLAGLTMLGTTGRFLGARFRVPLVGAYHTDFPAYTTHYGLGFLRDVTYSYLRWVHNGCALTLCPSSATLADLRMRGFRRLRLWGRGVDTERFHPQQYRAAFREQAGIQAHESLLLYVGRLASEKRVELLADALDGLHDVRLVFVGDGPARPALERRLAGKPAFFTGYLHGQALAEAYASADLFSFPSDTETFGQVIQEAMASGLPVIAARAGGAIDLVREGRSGLLFNPGNAADLRQQIQRLANDAPMRAAMGQAGRALAECRSWTSVMSELTSHYERVLIRTKSRAQRMKNQPSPRAYFGR